MFGLRCILDKMAEELQLDMQKKPCQASEETLRAIAVEFKIEISEQRRSTIVCLIFQYIDKKMIAKTDEEGKSFLQGQCSRHFKTTEANNKSVQEENLNAPVPQKLENPTLQNVLESTSVFRRQFEVVGQIGHAKEKDKLSFTSLTRQVDSGLKQGYSEQEIVDGVIRAISAGMVLRSHVETFKELSLERLRKILQTIMVSRIVPNFELTKAWHRYAKGQKRHRKNSLCVHSIYGRKSCFQVLNTQMRTLWFMKLTTFNFGL